MSSLVDYCMCPCRGQTIIPKRTFCSGATSSRLSVHNSYSNTDNVYPMLNDINEKDCFRGNAI